MKKFDPDEFDFVVEVTLQAGAVRTVLNTRIDDRDAALYAFRDPSLIPGVESKYVVGKRIVLIPKLKFYESGWGDS